jgi:hypothetical protein
VKSTNHEVLPSLLHPVVTSCRWDTNTRLLIIPDTLQKSVHFNGAKDGNTRHTDTNRNSPSLYVPRVLSYVGGRQGCRLSENGDANTEGILRAWVCPNTVDNDGAAMFSNQVRKGPAGEEQHKAMVRKIATWRVRRRIITAISRIDREKLLGRNGLSAWRLPRHKGRTHRAFVSYAK